MPTSPRFENLRPAWIRRFGLLTCRQGSGPIGPGPPFNPDIYDVLVTDVDYYRLTGEISKMLGHDYQAHAPPPLKPLREINGTLYGAHRRPLFGIATTFQQRSHYIHFLYDTSLPFTFLSCDVNGDQTRPL